MIKLRSRRVEIAGIIQQPDGDWMLQVGRTLLDAEDGFLAAHRYLILDSDPLYTREFRTLLRREGVEPVRLPAKSPNLNAYAERFVLSIKSDCLSKLVLLGERHLRSANDNRGTSIQCRQRVGGLLRFYYRSAA